MSGALADHSLSPQGGWSLRMVGIMAVTYLMVPAMAYSMTCINAPSEIIKAFMNETETARTGVPMPSSRLETLFGLFVAVVGIGAVVGSVVSDSVADRIGRKYTILISLVIGCVGTLIMCLCQVAKSYEMLFVGRAITGLATGLGLTLTVSYIMEICLPHQKGAAALVNILSQGIAILVAQVLGYQELLGNEDYWIYLIAVPLIPLALQLLLFPLCPQNPRYLLLQRNNEAAAIKAFQKIRGYKDVQSDIKYLRQEIVESAITEQVSVWSLFVTPTLRRPLLVAIILGLHQDWCGLNGILFFSTALFEDTGVTGAASRYATSGTGAIFALGNFLAVLLLPRLGRKPVFLGGTVSVGVACAVFAVVMVFEDEVPALKYVNIAVSMVIVLSVALGPVTVFWVIIGEIFPHSARGAGFSVAILCAFTGLFSHNYALPVMLEAFHAYTFFIFSGINALVVLFCVLYLPETKDKTFAEIALTWSKTSDATTLSAVGGKDAQTDSNVQTGTLEKQTKETEFSAIF